MGGRRTANPAARVAFMNFGREVREAGSGFERVIGSAVEGREIFDGLLMKYI